MEYVGKAGVVAVMAERPYTFTAKRYTFTYTRTRWNLWEGGSTGRDGRETVHVHSEAAHVHVHEDTMELVGKTGVVAVMAERTYTFTAKRYTFTYTRT